MKTIYSIYVICLIYAISACSNMIEEDNLPVGEFSPDQQEISFKNGMMILKSSNTLTQILQKKLSYTNVAFTSQQDILDKLTLEEQNHALFLRNLSDSDYAIAKKHSDLYYTLLQKEFIKIDKFTDGSELYSLNVAMPNYGKVLNLDGFFAIQDTIYQITPNMLKIWVNGNLNDYNILNKINTDDVTKGIYVFDYNSKKQEAIQTRANLPIIKIRNQKVAFYAENASGKGRGIYTFYDQTTLNLPAGAFNRNIYIRVSHQEKLDGRNYSFTDAPYFIRFGYTDMKKPDVTSGLSTNGNGADDWYTVYFQYQILNPGKDVQLITTSEEYITLSSVWFNAEFYVGNSDKHIYLNVSGDTKYQEDVFIYSSVTATELVPLLPE